MIGRGGGRNSLVDQPGRRYQEEGEKEEREVRKSSAGARVVRSLDKDVKLNVCDSK